MSDIARETGEAGRGELTASSGLWQGQGDLFAPPKPTFRQFLRWLVRNEYAAVALRIFGGEDVEDAEKNLSRVLSPNGNGNGKRHLDVSWLDAIAEVVPDGEEQIARFVCERYGFLPPIRKPSAARTEERIQRLEKTAEDLTGAAQAIVDELKAMRGAK